MVHLVQVIKTQHNIRDMKTIRYTTAYLVIMYNWLTRQFAIIFFSYKRVLLKSAMKVIEDRQVLILEKKKTLVQDITQMVVQ